MNIALFADNFYPQVNGVATAIHNLAQGLAKRGHKVLVIAPRYRSVKSYPQFHPNVQVLTVRGGPAFFYKGLKITVPFSKKILKALKANNIEILHFHAPLGLGLQAIIFAKLLQLPLVGTFHTFFFDDEYRKHVKVNFKFLQSLCWKMARFFYNSCDLISVPVPSTKKLLADNGCVKPIVVISNGIDQAVFKESMEHASKWSIDWSRPTALFVGRIAHEKNLSALIDVFDLVVKKIPKAQLCIVGGGPQLVQLKKLISKLNLWKNIIVLGEVEHKKLVASGLYTKARLFVTASRTENQPLTLLEALCNGLPCIGMNVRGIPDIIVDGENGYLVEKDNLKVFSDRIIDLMVNDEHREKMHLGALRFVEAHRIELIIDRWENAYSGLIDEHSVDNKGGQKDDQRNYLQKSI